MLLEATLEAPQAVGMNPFWATLNVQAYLHQRFPPISPLAHSWPKE